MSTKATRLRGELRQCFNDITKQLELSDPDDQPVKPLVENLDCYRQLANECELLIAECEKAEMETDRFAAYPVCPNCGCFCPHNDHSDSASECCCIEMDCLDTLIDDFNEEEK